eukprot:CAMPEP_0170275112 /NCGR_PEP_ID=MMETSP0116_2-20130129/37530_1 /TAXON_ID=400756 /ORGANISM="Durinskia baltica, Strain CSIRO CS-38" /LENGTH=94 /DNA_ID=CAMNT_0010526363 /DNA_START=174 /DNA_END=454 /DNA_ORIENTATION=-
MMAIATKGTRMLEVIAAMARPVFLFVGTVVIGYSAAKADPRITCATAAAAAASRTAARRAKPRGAMLEFWEAFSGRGTEALPQSAGAGGRLRVG